MHEWGVHVSLSLSQPLCRTRSLFVSVTLSVVIIFCLSRTADFILPWLKWKGYQFILLHQCFLLSWACRWSMHNVDAIDQSCSVFGSRSDQCRTSCSTSWNVCFLMDDIDLKHGDGSTGFDLAVVLNQMLKCCVKAENICLDVESVRKWFANKPKRFLGLGFFVYS